MSPLLTIKNSSQEAGLFVRRIIAIAIFIVILSLLLLGRLVVLQFFQHDYYTTLSDQNEIDLIPLAPNRGLIFDRQGILLSNNTPVYSLIVTPSRTENLDTSVQALARRISLSQTDLDQFYQQLKTHRRFEQIPLKIRLSEEDVARFMVDQYRYPGFSINTNLMRQYPFGSTFSHVLGYVGRINQDEIAHVNPANYAGTNFMGKLGTEKFYEPRLHGQVGYQRAEIDAGGRIVRDLSTIKPVKGADLYLTINAGLQTAAEKALEGNRGAIVAINPKNGEVLALVSEPGYDPNLFVSGISQKDFNILINDKSHPLYNRAIHGLYAPGSIIKPFMAIAGLDSGTTTPTAQINDPGWYQIPGTTHIFHDWKWWTNKGGHGLTNVTKAIIESVDTYFYDLAHRMGIDLIDRYLTAFGFGQKTGIDLGEELAGNIPSPGSKLRYQKEPWYAGDTVQTGIGQSFFQVTPLQLATATTILANRGLHYWPHLIYAERLPNGHFVYELPRQLPPIVLKNSTDWDVVIHAMAQVVTKGTGTPFGQTPYSVAAKTGTVQLIGKGANGADRATSADLRNNSTFIAFAPVNNPQIAIAVVVENNAPNAAVVARKVLDYYLLDEHHLSLATETPHAH